MTKYYYYETNGGRGILATDGKKMFDCTISAAGIDQNTEINIFDSDFEVIKEAYQKIKDDLYDMDDIKRDFPDNITDFIEADFELLKLIIEI